MVMATGRSWIGRPVVVCVLFAALFAWACKGPAFEDQGEVLELDGQTVRLEPGIAVADVLLGSGGNAPLDPDSVRIRPGDVVRFTAADARAHAVTFDRERLPPGGADFLERSGQLRSPPLLTTGSRWIIRFENAPPGAYPYIDASRGTQGVIVVARPAPRD